MRTGPLFSSASDRWATPSAVYAALDSEFRFNFDPCPLDGTGDGLSPLFCEWRGKRVFCNPPYGPGVGEWLKRGLDAEVAVFLIPARTDTRWFHEIVLPHADQIRFIKGRLKFGDAKYNAPFPSMVVVFSGRETGHPANQSDDATEHDECHRCGAPLHASERCIRLICREEEDCDGTDIE